ncbi:MAG: glutamate-1-semialdehyde 2,1-aminomutase [Candidatus Omnitrophica bacterium]|nr:glutamate-1-semialdehyde 2,1-aminomutase [Candidatus Omnitrophota bacterium]
MKKNFGASGKCYTLAAKYIPGGVNSPVRAFKAVGKHPIFISSGNGAYIRDVDGNKFIDYVMSWGPLILGHADEMVLRRAAAAMKRGTTFGAPTVKEIELARLITEIYPSIKKVRLTSSGTEAAMSAIRLARGFTGREKILKFEGCYHGHADSLLVKAGSGAATFGVPSSKGINKSVAADTIVVPFNDIEKFEAAVKREKGNIACVILEPIPANMGLVLPRAGFHAKIREITKENGIVLIFDEVISGFRVALGGAQEIYGIKPDLTVLGKILGGGFPIGAFGGRDDIMGLLAPDGPVYQAGTLSGNPVAVEAGIATIKALMKKGTYGRLNDLGGALEEGIGNFLLRNGVNVTMKRCGSLFTLFFTGKRDVIDYDDASGCDTKAFASFFRGMLSRGVYLAPSQFEANFISLKHSFKDIKRTVQAAEGTIRGIKIL